MTAPSLKGKAVIVTACERICMYGKKINLSGVPAGQTLGIKEVDEGIWLVSFMDYDLGYIEVEQRTLQPLDTPFGPRLSPMSWVRSITYVSGLDRRTVVARARYRRSPRPDEALFLLALTNG